MSTPCIFKSLAEFLHPLVQYSQRDTMGLLNVVQDQAQMFLVSCFLSGAKATLHKHRPMYPAATSYFRAKSSPFIFLLRHSSTGRHNILLPPPTRRPTTALTCYF